MKLIYHDRDIDIFEKKSFMERLIGFMGKRNIKYAIYFDHCNSIHTFFMKENIDVIMCNKNNEILYFYKNLPKNKIIFPKKGVYRVIETPKNYFNIKINDKIRMVK